MRSTLQNNSTVARFFVLIITVFIFTTFELFVSVEPELFVRSAHAFVEAEADFEDQEKLGEAAMQFFYASKVLLRSLTIVLQASSMFVLASEIILFFNPGWG